MKAVFILLFAAAVSKAAGLNDPKELESFIDGLVDGQLRSHHIGGATVSIVEDGKILLAKGYGYADLQQRRPVLADRTLFRIASISKPILWTAVMQLAEKGKLDLHADVNRYLKDFQIPASFPQPITMHHLLTHTAGFEDVIAGLFPEDPKDIRPLAQAVAHRVPARVRPPGEVVAYSNYSSGLAGYIVQVISGMPYEDYLEQNIFGPLRMTHTSVRQPVPPPLASDLSTGYKKGSQNDYKEGKFEFVNRFPAGSVSSTATDMANFMIAHLHGGQLNGVRILSEESARKMHRLAFTLAPAVGGPTYGFWQRTVNGKRVIEHGGDTMLFHSILMLLPEENVGLFASYNTSSGAPARGELQQAFLDRYFPPQPVKTARPNGEPGGDLERFAGYYRSTRREYTRLLSMSAILESVGGVVHVGVEPDGTLRTRDAKWVRVAPLVFRSLDGRSTIAFREDNAGHVTQLVPSPYSCFERVGLAQTPPAHLIWMGACTLMFVAAIVGWPIAALTRPLKPRGAFRIWATCLAGAMAILAIGVGLTFALTAESLVTGLTPLIRAVLYSGFLVVLLAVATAVCAVIAWRKSVWSLPMRIHYSAVAIAGLMFIAWLQTWNLLGVHY